MGNPEWHYGFVVTKSLTFIVIYEAHLPSRPESIVKENIRVPFELNRAKGRMANLFLILRRQQK